jgi:hypothetical protein
MTKRETTYLERDGMQDPIDRLSDRYHVEDLGPKRYPFWQHLIWFGVLCLFALIGLFTVVDWVFDLVGIRWV